MFFLIAATYTHDIGMANLEGYKEYAVPRKYAVSKSTSQSDKAEYIRKNHHMRTEEFIVNNAGLFGLEIPEAKLIGLICRGHRVEDLTNKDRFPEKEPFRTSHTINIALLSLLLRLADECELTFERTPQVLIDLKVFSSMDSKLEWERHAGTIGISKDPDDPMTLLCKAECQKPTIYRSLRKIGDKINHELNYLPDLLGFHSKPTVLASIPRKMRLDIKTRDFLPFDFKFSMDKDAIFNLLGPRLYDRKGDSIREILKNAIDTCRYKREITDEQDYEPKIKFKKEKDRLIVSDNGMGMDKHHVEYYLTVIGRSFYASNEFSLSKQRFIPLSELGIGILSYFLISNVVEIETKARNTDALRIIIDDSSDYFLVYPSSKYQDGTVVTLHLKEETTDPRPPFIFEDKKDHFLRTGSFYDIVRHYARHIEFPIGYEENSEKKSIIELDYIQEYRQEAERQGQYLPTFRYQLLDKDREWFEMAMKDITGTFNLRKAPTLTIIARKISNPGLDGFVALVVAKDENSEILPWLSFPGHYLFRSNKALSINGILISDNYQLFDDRYTYEEIILFDLDIKFPVKLNTSRDSLIDEDQLDHLRTIIFEHLCLLIKEFITSIGTINDDRKCDINNQMLYHIMHSKDYTLGIPSVRKLLKHHFVYRCVSKTEILYMTADDVKRDRSIVRVNLPDFLDNKVIDELVNKNASFKRDKKYIFNHVGHVSWEFVPTIIERGIRKFISKEQYDEIFKDSEEVKKMNPISIKSREKYDI